MGCFKTLTKSPPVKPRPSASIIKARAKGLGASPALEMYQTSFMGNVIKEGTTDISQWKDSTRIKFVRTSIKSLMEEMEDASEEQRKSLKEEIPKIAN